MIVYIDIIVQSVLVLYVFFLSLGMVSIAVGCLTFVLIENKPIQNKDKTKDNEQGKLMNVGYSLWTKFAIFLAHPIQRVIWSIAITWCPSPSGCRQ